MPWKIVSLVRARQQLVELMLARRQTLQTLCRRFGVSRKTAYKWLAHFRRRGLAGLHDRSRRPRRSPQQLAAPWVKAILDWRRRRPHWGAKKIWQRLHQTFPRRRVPCVRSIHRCLQRAGRVRPHPRRARKGPFLPAPGLTRPRRPNQVWTVDFKGWFCTADGQRQEPLTVRDLFSRYGLCLRLLPNQDDTGARRVFQRLFRQRGLPGIIRVDNGSPRGHRGVGIVAVVGLVAAVGHPRRVHPPGTPGRQRGPRTVSRLLPAGGGGRGRAATTTPATAFGSLVDELQSRPSARGLGTTHASRSLSPESAALSPGAATLGLSQSLGSATSAQPGTHQMAWTTAVHRSGFCGPEPRTEIGGRSAWGGVSGQTTHRPTPRQGCRRSAPRSLAAPVVIEGVTVSPMSCHSCVTHVLSPCQTPALPISIPVFGLDRFHPSPRGVQHRQPDQRIPGLAPARFLLFVNRAQNCGADTKVQVVQRKHSGKFPASRGKKTR